jgi:DNA-binding NarL/FixJ family response regulator
LIVDDHDFIRDSLRAAFLATEVEVVAEAAGGRAALARVAEHHPDVALVDLSMSDGDGLEFLERVRHAAPQLRVLIYSANGRPVDIRRSRALGASGYLIKGVDDPHVVDAVRTVGAGQSLWDQSRGAS